MALLLHVLYPPHNYTSTLILSVLSYLVQSRMHHHHHHHLMTSQFFSSSSSAPLGMACFLETDGETFVLAHRPFSLYTSEAPHASIRTDAHTHTHTPFALPVLTSRMAAMRRFMKKTLWREMSDPPKSSPACVWRITSIVVLVWDPHTPSCAWCMWVAWAKKCSDLEQVVDVGAGVVAARLAAARLVDGAVVVAEAGFAQVHMLSWRRPRALLRPVAFIHLSGALDFFFFFLNHAPPPHPLRGG